MSAKKNENTFDSLKTKADGLMGKLEEEGEETSEAAKSFRSIVMHTLGLHMRMIVWLYQYVRAMQVKQKAMDEQAVLEGMDSIVDAALTGGPKLLSKEAGSNAREIVPPSQESATLPYVNSDSQKDGKRDGAKSIAIQTR